MVEKQSRTKEKAGITLIALIITVIVMLILAGVAINLTIGDNGIFKKSEEGAQVYKNSANDEARNLNDVDSKMGELINQYHEGNTGGSNPTEKPGKPDENGIYTENSTINKEEESASNPEIPKGFKPVDVDDAIWGTEEGYKKGLVIEDEEGNQFVWIAVDGETVKLRRYVFTETGEIDAELSKTEPTEQLKLESSYRDDYYTEGLKDDTTGIPHAKDIEGFRNSVAEHGGYYIARYEASYGVDNKPNSKVSEGTPNTDNGEEYAPTQEGQLWNNITQPSAAQACQNMYDSSYGATSDLVNSYAWDTAILFIQTYSDAPDYSRQTSLNTTLANTGTTGDEKCHIQDMASNCNEWTTETHNSYYVSLLYVSRGGDYYTGNTYTSNRGVCDISLATPPITFRPILYL